LEEVVLQVKAKLQITLLLGLMKLLKLRILQGNKIFQIIKAKKEKFTIFYIRIKVKAVWMK
jgi:hypothetical protein